MITVGLIRPPLPGHVGRGIGTYYTKLKEALLRQKEIRLIEKDFVQNFSDVDIIHFPYFDLFFQTLKIHKHKPVVVTVHDLIPLRFPVYYPVGIKGTIKWWIQKNNLKKAEMVITDSEASRKDIVNIAGIPSGKIRVIYPGVDGKFFTRGEEKRLLLVKNRYHLPDKFLLYVGDVNYNKNIPVLLKSFSKIHAQFSDCYLVLAGLSFKGKSKEAIEISESIKSLTLSDFIVKPGYIESEELPFLYQLASVYVQPSLFEGFGLPVLEAMASKCPVVTSKLGSLSEVGGDGCLYADPDDPNDFADKIITMLSNSKLRENLILKAQQLAKKFDWNKTARQTIDGYKSLV